MASVLSPSVLLSPCKDSAMTPNQAPTFSPPSILLNAPSKTRHTPISSPSLSPTSERSSLPRTNSSSSSDDTSKSGRGSRSNSQPRKIRFAPLPDINRTADLQATVLQLTEPAANNPDLAPSPLLANVLLPSNSSVGGDSDAATETGSDTTQKKRKGWSKRILATLTGSSNSNDNETSSSALWRTTSRDSVQSNGSTSEAAAQMLGFPLGRRRSTSAADTRGRSPLMGAPLTLTHSMDGSGAPVRRQRMLNGRVYGARNTAPTKVEEPSFVEWGYGGMGSVNNSTGNSQYAKLQSDKKVSVGADGGGGAVDDDDGSGMAWVKRRREQRAKEEAERKEKEAAEKAAAEKLSESPVQETTSLPSDLSTKDSNVGLEQDQSTPIVGTRTPLVPSRRSSEMQDPNLEHHYVHAVSIPATRSNTHSRNVSASSLKDIVHGSNPSGATSPSKNVPRLNRMSETSEASDLDSEDDDSSDEDSEDEDEKEEQNRITSQCAGVEKISRHKD